MGMARGRFFQIACHRQGHRGIALVGTCAPRPKDRPSRWEGLPLGAIVGMSPSTRVGVRSRLENLPCIELKITRTDEALAALSIDPPTETVMVGGPRGRRRDGPQ